MSFKFVSSWLTGKTLLHWVAWSSEFSVYTDRSLIHHSGLNSCISFQKLSEITSDSNIHIWRALLLTNNCMIFEVVVNYIHVFLKPFITATPPQPCFFIKTSAIKIWLIIQFGVKHSSKQQSWCVERNVWEGLEKFSCMRASQKFA